MNIKKNNSGFTLLEIIIVIIIVGVLASLALPRLFATVEYSRSTEALSAITSIRSSMERCYLQNNGNYANCGNGGFGEIDVDDPAGSPGAHFGYGIGVDANAPTINYTITATRNATDGGTAGHTVVATQTAAGVARSGNGAFSGLK